MEKRVLGIVLTLLGVIGLIMAGISFMHPKGHDSVKEVVVYGILGLIFFLAGIGLVRTVKDVIRRDEHIS